MATSRTKTTSTRDIGTVDDSKESATQDSVPVPANTDEDSVPEVEEATGSLDFEEQKGKWVVWTGAQHFEIRTITPQDWAKIGIENGRTVHWYAGNKHRVALENLDFLTDSQLQQYILSEPRFEIVEE